MCLFFKHRYVVKRSTKVCVLWMGISPMAATVNTLNRAVVLISVSMYICFVSIKQCKVFGLGCVCVCNLLNSNPKSPDRQETGKEVVLGA